MTNKQQFTNIVKGSYSMTKLHFNSKVSMQHLANFLNDIVNENWKAPTLNQQKYYCDTIINQTPKYLQADK